MPKPTLRGSTYWFDLRIPKDLHEAMGKKRYHESLKTKDWQEAVTRFAVRLAQAHAEWAAHRTNPKAAPVTLTHKQCVALAGEIRSIWISAFDDNPGSEEKWTLRMVSDIRAQAGAGSLKIGPDRITDSLNLRYGRLVDNTLKNKELAVDKATRTKLLHLLSTALHEANRVNLLKAGGDYSPDEGAAAYPVYAPPEAPTKAPSPAEWTFDRAIDAEVERRSLGSDAVPLRPNTIKKYRRVATMVTAFRGSADVSTLTVEELDGWIRSMQLEGKVSNKTINDRMTSLKTIVNYARNKSFGKVLPFGNPVAQVERPKVKSRKPGLYAHTPAEARSILLACRKETKPELRWVPWLTAYSGARVSEIAQLTPSDFRQVEGRWFFDIGAAGAGSVKNDDSMRSVPVHPDLVKEGLLSFISNQPRGRLFPVRTNDNVGEWVKNVLGGGREGLRPSHGWRHLFEDLCMGTGISDAARSYITGRSTGSSADQYRGSDAMLPGLAREMDKYPSYL
jgi:integrase